MEQINHTIRCCATCAYWLGYRVPNRLGYIDVLSKTDAAKCGKRGLNESRAYQACSSCAGWSKWQVLQKP